MTQPSSPSPLSLRQVFQTWWPLAASWMLMSIEQPAAQAVITRLPHFEVNLAAWGVVFGLSLIIEAPIIMLLAASTALSKDWRSYLWLRRFMMVLSAALTAVHVLVAFTPLYDVVMRAWLGSQADVAAVIAAARPGLMLMTPWTWAVAYRRFQQGVLIRFGHSRAIGVGTLIRLGSMGTMLTIGYVIGTLPGTAVAGAAIAAGVMSEAIYAGLRVRPVLRDQLRPAPPVTQPLALRSFLSFYVPLSMTSLLYLLVNPIITFALSRMPDPVASLDVWPVISGLTFILRSAGMAYNEVVVALLGESQAVYVLRRFTSSLTAVVTVAMVLVAATPLSTLWYAAAMGLPPELTALARQAFWLALPLPGLNVLQSWFQGSLVHHGRTRGITEATGVYLAASSVVMLAGTLWGHVPGLYVGLAGLAAGFALQATWLWRRSRPILARATTAAHGERP
jgi:hypothetical protein